MESVSNDLVICLRETERVGETVGIVGQLYVLLGRFPSNSIYILYLSSKTTATSTRIPEEDTYYRAGNIFPHAYM